MYQNNNEKKKVKPKKFTAPKTDSHNVKNKTQKGEVRNKVWISELCTSKSWHIELMGANVSIGLIFHTDTHQQRK